MPPRQPRPTEAAAPAAQAAPVEDASGVAEPAEASPAPVRNAGSRPVEAAAEARNRSEARRAARNAPVKKKRQHGMAYRWIRAYAPILLGLFVLLGALWVYTSFIKPPTPAQQWQTIVNKWTPEREKARAVIAVDVAAPTLDVAKWRQDVHAYVGQIKGWTDDTAKVKDWGDDTANQAASRLVLNGQAMDSLLASVDKVQTVDDVAAMRASLGDYDDQFTANVLAMSNALQVVTPVATPTPLAFPSVAPSPEASGSPGASASPAPTNTPAPGPTVTPAPSAT